MNSRIFIKLIGIVVIGHLLLVLGTPLHGYELYLFRRFDSKDSLTSTGKVVMHGELFGQIQSPSTFPSYNDLSGEDDRWNFGFHDYWLITPSTLLHAQLVTHDDGGKRTKFDWHFSLRQDLLRNLALIVGHDSDHDSDHLSLLRGKPFYTNRNYIGLALPFPGRGFVIEPFIQLFHHTNQRAHLDLSGEKLEQEIGLRLGGAFSPYVALSLQVIWQSRRVFRPGETALADLILRFRVAPWLEFAMGGSFWGDRLTSPAGNKQSFYKLVWGIAIPF